VPATLVIGVTDGVADERVIVSEATLQVAAFFGIVSDALAAAVPWLFWIGGAVTTCIAGTLTL
jgi:hypothetical protein